MGHREKKLRIMPRNEDRGGAQRRNTFKLPAVPAGIVQKFQILLFYADSHTIELTFNCHRSPKSSLNSDFANKDCGTNMFRKVN